VSERIPVRTVVVDDEPPARERIVGLLARERDIELVGEAGGGRAAIKLIRDMKPDLVLLDVQMPGCDGFEVLRETAPLTPGVIFVTAHGDHAIQAFDVAAVDYLLKPVVEARFHAAVRRAVSRMRDANSGVLASQLAALIASVPTARAEQIPLWCDGRVAFVRARDVDRIEADDDHVRVYAAKAVYLTRETMSKIEARLPAGFVRVHRSTIVNAARIREVQHWVKGDYLVILQDGTKITSGRTYRDRVQALLPP